MKNGTASFAALPAARSLVGTSLVETDWLLPLRGDRKHPSGPPADWSPSRTTRKVRVAVIENPSSGINARNPGDLERLCAQRGLDYRAGRTAEEMELGLGELLEREPDILVLSGGDGTISSILGAIHYAEDRPTRPLLALLRGGSTNMTQRELGLSGKPTKALEKLLNSVRKGIPETQIQWRSPLVVRNGEFARVTFGFFFAIGAMQRVLHACQETTANGGARGLAIETLGLVDPFLRLLFRGPSKTGILQPDSIHWTPENTDPTGNWEGGTRMFVYLTSLNRLIFGFDPRGRRDALKLVGLKYPFRKRTLVSYLLSRGRSGWFGSSGLEHDSSDEYSLKFSGQWVLDGEFYGDPHGSTTLNIRTGMPVPFLAL